MNLNKLKNYKRYIPKYVKQFVRCVLGQENNPFDVRGLTDNPIEAIYLAKNRPFVVDAEINKCRSFFYTGYTYNAKLENPAVSFLLEANKKSIIKKSALEKYSLTWQPRSAGEVLGLMGKGASRIHSLPSNQFVYPWESIDPVVREERLKREEFYYKDQEGKVQKILKGQKLYGPLNPDHMQVEIHRLISVYNSVSLRGFERNDGIDGDISCHLLVYGDDYVFSVNVGTHRAAAVSALGFRTVPVRVTQIIRREDSVNWPHVKDGLFTLSEAEYVFDRFLNGSCTDLQEVR